MTSTQYPTLQKPADNAILLMIKHGCPYSLLDFYQSILEGDPGQRGGSIVGGERGLPLSE